MHRSSMPTYRQERLRKRRGKHSTGISMCSVGIDALEPPSRLQNKLPKRMGVSKFSMHTNFDESYSRGFERSLHALFVLVAICE